MKGKVNRGCAGALLAMALGVSAGMLAGDAQNVAGAAPKEQIVTEKASGEFEVKLTPASAGESSDGITLSRMTIDKTFRGDLEGTSKGEMLSAVTGVHGSAGYVAIERVTGTLAGRSGTFVLQHNGVMNRGEPELRIVVVPDSATGELKGLAGSMTIKIEKGKHFYEFGYFLPQEPEAR